MHELSDTALDILDIIKSNQGIHFRPLQKKLNKEVGITKHHLRKFEKINMI